MPMPKARPVPDISSEETKDVEPSLLEERRAWVRQDREVKLDMFLSVAEEVMQEVFEVGPPLPPINHTSQEMLQALDDNFGVFSFSGYHHAFCHFLNLHIDQYASIQDFNTEFTTVLEDLIDYGHPLSNTQACSAYLSKLRCTQNPGVAKKLEELDTLSTEPDIHDLMQESLSWPCIRPLATKSSQVFQVQPVSEECRTDNGSHSHGDPPGLSDTSTVSSEGSRSRQLSIKVNHPQWAVTRASDNVDPQDLREAIEKLLTTGEADPSSLNYDASAISACATPDWLKAQEKAFSKPLPIAEPPAPTESHTLRKTASESRARSASPRLLAPLSRTVSQTTLSDHPAFRDNPFLPKERAQSDSLLADTNRPEPRPDDYEPPHSAPLPHPYQYSAYSSNSSSAISLPIQGTNESSWSYGSNNSDGIEEHILSPVASSMLLPPMEDRFVTIQRNNAPLPPLPIDTNVLQWRTPTFDDLVPPPPPKKSRLRKTSSTLDMLKRLSGDSLLESSDEVREREEKKRREKERKGKSWSIGSIARFTHSKGVK
ncbi:uncharacterized protein J4E79_004880 [Alternaria viburni]|uniref:uncharacterized protein n=1 Tax=Alternaria viburni TaxID=566460 RepID=UPI0020C55E89|nr:uncharacterized protein J4E79_004880 [Alternaria viburni]KAI4662589.1 hypothetical protein J4E79_004880 [Alternaria viburni]